MKKIYNNLIKFLRYFLKEKKLNKVNLNVDEETQEKIKRLTYTKRTD
jgi:hypothetical protein